MEIIKYMNTIFCCLIVTGCSEPTLEEKINNTKIIGQHGTPPWDISGIKLGHDISIVNHIPLCSGTKRQTEYFKRSDIVLKYFYNCTNKRDNVDYDYEEIFLTFSREGSLMYVSREIGISSHIDINEQLQKVKDKFGNAYIEHTYKPGSGRFKRGTVLCYEETKNVCVETQKGFELAANSNAIYFFANAYHGSHLPNHSVIRLYATNKVEAAHNDSSAESAFQKLNSEKQSNIKF